MFGLKKSIQNMVIAALMLALGLVLPFVTGQIPQIGNMLLPMHIPVFLCGLMCGPMYGLAVGFVVPLFRSVLFGMPVIYPTAIAMAFELATYGFVSGFLYSRSKWQCVRALYRCLIISMISGRVIWAAAEIILLGIGGNMFTWQMFISGAFLNAIPGIVIQLIFIPSIMVALNKSGLVPYKKIQTAKSEMS